MRMGTSFQLNDLQKRRSDQERASCGMDEDRGPSGTAWSRGNGERRSPSGKTRRQSIGNASGERRKRHHVLLRHKI